MVKLHFTLKTCLRTIWLSCLSNVFIILDMARISAAVEFIQGSVIPCETEGQLIAVPWISDDPCISCRCQNAEVVCKKQDCPQIDGCYLLLFGKRPSCCDVCKGCLYDGVVHANGDIWTDRHDPCTTFTCQAGVVTQSSMECYVPCRKPFPPDPGECCPSCDVCITDGLNYTDGELIIDEKDPCIKCRCQNGTLACYKTACPVLPCPPSKFVHYPGSCCPECRGSRRTFELHGKCLLGMHAYRHGETLNYDQCTECTCNISTSICERAVCPTLHCPPEHQVINIGQCCAQCREPEEKKAACVSNGKLYKWLIRYGLKFLTGFKILKEW